MITSILSVQAPGEAEKKKDLLPLNCDYWDTSNMIQFSFFKAYQQLCINPFLFFLNVVNKIVLCLVEGLTYLCLVAYL